MKEYVEAAHSMLRVTDLVEALELKIHVSMAARYGRGLEREDEASIIEFEQYRVRRKTDDDVRMILRNVTRQDAWRCGPIRISLAAVDGRRRRSTQKNQGKTMAVKVDERQ